MEKFSKGLVYTLMVSFAIFMLVSVLPFSSFTFIIGGLSFLLMFASAFILVIVNGESLVESSYTDNEFLNYWYGEGSND